MDDIEKLVPKDKFDVGTIDTLMEMDEDDVQPILPRLLLWIADMNWPVAKQMLPVLVPHIKAALAAAAQDNVLKYWIVQALLPLFSYEAQYALWQDFSRIACQPTEGEKQEEVDVAAREFDHMFCINNGLGLLI